MKKQKEIEDRKREVAEKRRLKQLVLQRYIHFNVTFTTHSIALRSLHFTDIALILELLLNPRLR